MLEALAVRYRSVQRRVRRIERRETRDLRRWLENTENVLHLSALVIVPLLIGAVTFLSNISPVVSFLVYPPLASGTYTLFADPGGRYSSPRKFVGGMTVGAFSGWIALEATARFWYTVPPDQFQVHAGAAALGVFLTGGTTWLFKLEVPTAFSSALLVLITGSDQLTYVAGIAVSSLLVAGVFAVWRREFYHERARYLFQSTHGDDQVLIPLRGHASVSAVLFAARLAAAHEAGKVVLMETVSPEVIEETEAEIVAERSERVSQQPKERIEETTRAAEDQVTEDVLDRLEALQARIEMVVDVPCEFVVAVADSDAAGAVRRIAKDENCDLIVCPYETAEDGPTDFVRAILSWETDAVVFRSSNGRTEWHRILVMVRSPGEIANAMLAFGDRLVAEKGMLGACTCISQSSARRRAEIMLESLVEAVATAVETRIAHGTVEEFLTNNASHYDLMIIGASTDRGVVSRVLSTPTFERIQDVDCDLAIVHRG